jgi:ATP synthase protein I
VSKLKTLRGYDEDAGELDYQPLTAAQAQSLREKNPAVSPWRVVGWQCLAGLVTALMVWGVSGQARLGGSALYGGAAVVLPTVLFVRALSVRQNGQNFVVLALRLLVWESVKLLLTVAILAAAPRVIEDVSWLALMGGLVVTLKVYWLALLWRSKPKQI